MAIHKVKSGSKFSTRGKYRTGALATGVMSALLISSCGSSGEGVGGIETSDGETVENAQSFLTEATQQWQETIPEENVEVSDSAGCFFAVDEEDAVTGDIACGGVRTTTAEDGEVWDLGEFEVRENSENEMNARAIDDWISQMERGVQRPAAALVDAEGESAPQAIDEIPAPPMPQLDSGLTLSAAALPEDLVQPDDDQVTPDAEGEIITPAGSVQLESVATLETIPVQTPDSDTGDNGAVDDDGAVEEGDPFGGTQDGDSDLDTDDGEVIVDLQGEPHAPADGENFLVLEYTFTPEDNSDDGWMTEENDYSASLALNDGGAQQTLAHFDASGGYSGSEEDAGQLLVSVSEDDANLVVSASGLDQELSLPSGERADNDVARGYYRDVTEQDENHEFDIADQTVTLNDNEYDTSLYLNLQQAGLTAFTEEGGGDGWAEPDMAWLLLEFDAVLEADSWRPQFLEYSPSIEVTDESGETHSASRTEDISRASWNESYQIAVQVPADAENLSFTQSVESRMEDSDDIIGISFAAESYDLAFPQDDESQDDGDGEHSDEESEDDSDEDTDEQAEAEENDE